MASITSEAENTFVKNLLGSNSDAWIGLNDIATQETYVWSDGTAFSYTSWDSSQPNNANQKQDCVLIKNTGKWDDVVCGGSRKFVCKTSTSTSTAAPVSSCTTPAPTTTVAATTISIPPSDKCATGWLHFGTKCYKLFTAELSFNDARASCRCDNGADLVSIGSAEENTQVSSLAGSTAKTWTGGNDLQTEGTYVWTDGTSFSYTNWKASPQQPNNGGTDGNQDCISMDTDGVWDDVSCSSTRQYICEKPDSDQTALTTPSICTSCDSTWTKDFDLSKCYKRVAVAAPGIAHDAAQQACVALSANLASVTSAYENTGFYIF